MVTCAALIGRVKLVIMDWKAIETGNLIALNCSQMEQIRGGAAISLKSIWDIVKGAFDFVMEYHQEILRGFYKGWNNF